MITLAALGIEIEPHNDGPEYGWFWRITSVRVYDWHGTAVTHEEATTAAVAYLVYLARQGGAALDGELVDMGPNGHGGRAFGRLVVEP